MTSITGIYAGSFDPFTLGHMDLVQRSLKLVDTLIIGIGQNSTKDTLFFLPERIAMIEGELARCNFPKGKTVKVMEIPNLTVGFAKEVGASLIFRGLRAVSDFDNEFKLCVVNRRLDKEVETVFIMTDEKYQFVSSAFTKEIARLGGDVSTFVSPAIALKLKQKFGE